MIVAGSTNPLLLASAGGYNLTNSLRFRKTASAYLSRSVTTTANARIGTFSGWIKRGTLSASQVFYQSWQGFQDDSEPVFGFTSADIFFISGYNTNYRITSQVFRDPSAWYHFVIAIDTTQATASNRVKLYVNGVEVTAFSTNNNPTLNQDFAFGLSGATNYLGRTADTSTQYFDGYMAEVNWVAGQALTPSSFGETNAKTGVWQPKKYSGTYGTNGYYLPFTDNSSTTTIGYDFSGNGNNFTTNNISLTAGSTYDSMTDVPTLTSATASNFCVLNPLDQNASTISAGNLNAVIATNASPNGMYVSATIGATSGKYYWETTYSSGSSELSVGVIDASSTFNTTIFGSGVGYFALNGNKYINGSSTSYGSTYTTNDVIGVALDLDGGTVTFYKNNTSQGAVTLPTGVSAWKPSFSNGTRSASQTIVANFGQRPFAYTPPTGFVALNTFNLPTPTIGATASTQAGKYFNIALYSGNSTARTISGLGFQPDFNWTKPRNAAGSHVLTDSVRGVTNFLETNSTGAEQTGSTGIQSWNSDGYALGTGNDWNITGETFVSWNWRASNATGVTNTAGSITSTVSANTSSGFSVVTYTGNGSSGATVGHGLGVAPKMIFVKSRGSTGNWIVYHSSIGNTGASRLNAAFGTFTDSVYWNNTSPTSTVFTIGTDGDVNSGSTKVAYCFSEIAGYSKFGSYTGNSSTDGAFVYTGFRPKFVLFKCITNSGTYWVIIDSARNTYNLANTQLFPNASDADTTGGSTDQPIDILSNGFKLRGTGGAGNESGQTYLYACFAENPFKYSLAR